MFEKITPEQAGISSDTIAKFIKLVNESGTSIHGMLMMKDGKIFTEEYWAPFHKDHCHRMYSQSKSFVGVAVGLLLEDKLISSLDDKIIDYFPEKLPENGVHKYLAEQTIKDMLTMCTAPYSNHKWMTSGDPDRTHLYFHDERSYRPSGTYFQYDSPGSQVLCSLVEKLSGKKLLDYLKEKLFNKMGTFKTAEVLKTPNGDSWGDSAMICTLRDIASFGQLCMQYGKWNGEQLMSESYLREATSKVVSNEYGFTDTCHQGYGYQIWRVIGNGFAFTGMGDQLTLCYPDKNVVFVFTSNNQGNDYYRHMMIHLFVNMILNEIKDTPLKENKAAQARLAKATKNLKLFALTGMDDSHLREKISGVTYVCEQNPMGIKKLWFTFRGKKSGTLHYVNAQGKKSIPFGINHNVFGKFPQYGFSNDVGGVHEITDFLYDDAVSAAWTDDRQLLIRVQIIDRYFANLCILFAFKDEYLAAKFVPAAEDFMYEYNGTMIAKKKV